MAPLLLAWASAANRGQQMPQVVQDWLQDGMRKWLARDIVVLLRGRLVGEIVLEEREGIAEMHGVEVVTH